MPRQMDPADARLVVAFLRSLRNWTQEELSAASGVDRGLISDYEQGDKLPRPKTLQRLTSAVGLPYSFVHTLLPVFRAARLAMEGRPAEDDPEADLAATLADGLDQAIHDAVMPRLTPFLRELAASLEEPSPPAPSRGTSLCRGGSRRR